MKGTMQAAFKTARGDFQIRDLPIPEITHPDYVLARVKAAGICGSDLIDWRVPNPQLVDWVVGHELAGEVIEVGESVTNVKKGDRVAIESLVGCGHCYWCRVGEYHLCPDLTKLRFSSLSRAFSEYVAGPAKNFFKIPEEINYDEAAILDVYGTSIHACSRTNIRMDETAVIIGSGSIGLSLLELAKIAGAKVIMIGKHDHQLELAKKLGAYAVINTTNEDSVNRILQVTEERGADKVYECVGGFSMTRTLPQAVSLVRRGGKIALVGYPGPEGPLKLDWNKILEQEIDLISVSSFSYWGNDPEFRIVLNLLINGKINPRSLITHRFPLTNINEAFDVAADKKMTKAIKVVIVS